MLTVWDPANHFINSEDMAAYLEAALEDGDSRLVAAALGDIARAKGMSHVKLDWVGKVSIRLSLQAGILNWQLS